jgi:hypothetical protein
MQQEEDLVVVSYGGIMSEIRQGRMFPGLEASPV